ncbi:hypothetical protein I5E68_09815 [Novosphingobium sp. YJ-S2-02]|uniref:Deoxynucleotide monophosphate kinase n=1 Tax=Novosphingobium aureum TaxID=2792964 RepID=A0A931HD52_9SPHN|nr:hypothetical protein [Novosphingobium aureum]MBH0113241.1 hypothetical protein [Novosphingobium aureum]
MSEMLASYPTTTCLIGFCSPVMGSGKTTAAQYLVDHHGFTRVTVAGPIKRMIHALLGCCGISASLAERYVNGDLKEVPIGDLGAFMPSYAEAMLDVLGPLPPHIELTRDMLLESLVEWGEDNLQPAVTSRRLQQTLGTEWGRDQVDENLWCHVAGETAHRERLAGRSVVIDDMRFPNELGMVQHFRGLPVRIVRPGVERQGEAHASEGKLDMIRMPEVVNAGSLIDFYAEVELLVAEAVVA